MITIRMAKSGLEYEEGMNHLWIRVTPTSPIRQTILQVRIPAGIYRRANLIGFYENEAGEIILGDLPESAGVDLFVELYTQEPIKADQVAVGIKVVCRDEGGKLIHEDAEVLLSIVPEEELDMITVNEEVVNKLKCLRPQEQGWDRTQTYTDRGPWKGLKIDSEHCSELEKKYRIDWTR